MKTRGAIMREAPGKWEIVELEVANPIAGEIQIQLTGCGLCHSDDHLATGDMTVETYPVCGGHEGAGVVVAVGPNTPGFLEGDHVVTLGTAGCGHCRWCAVGQQNLCDLNAGLMSGASPEDPSRFRLSLDGQRVGQMVGVSAFCETTTVSAVSAVKIADDIPLDKACLVGCGVTTGWGAAVHSAQVQPGDTVIVIGVGGIGLNAVQGARHSGAMNIIAVDPQAFKRESAQEFGATHMAATIEEAAELGRGMTNGQGADAAVVSVGVTQPDHVAQAFWAIRKGGTVAVVGLGKMTDNSLGISISELTFFQKRLQGSLYGASSPSRTVIQLLDLYRAGQLKLDELVTRTYTLDQINDGYADLHAGKNLRAVVMY